MVVIISLLYIIVCSCFIIPMWQSNFITHIICKGDFLLMKKPTYIKCPRCELNYIKSTESYCPVCLAELKLSGETFDDYDENEDELELCPVCGQNFISPNKKMCEECARTKEIDGEEEDEQLDSEEDRESVSTDDNWEDDEKPIDDDVELVPLSSLEEDDEDDDEESEEEDSDKIDAFEEDFKIDDDFEDDFDEEDEDDEEDDEDDDEDDEDDEDTRKRK